MRSLEKRTSSKICTVCRVSSNQKASFFLISCVFWIFFQNAGCQLCFRFFFFFLNFRHTVSEVVVDVGDVGPSSGQFLMMMVLVEVEEKR